MKGDILPRLGVVVWGSSLQAGGSCVALIGYIGRVRAAKSITDARTVTSSCPYIVLTFPCSRRTVDHCRAPTERHGTDNSASMQCQILVGPLSCASDTRVVVNRTAMFMTIFFAATVRRPAVNYDLRGSTLGPKRTTKPQAPSPCTPSR